ncbi:MAG TPA: DUF4870 domain-containing protein [Terriglobales bacterium]|nr:DUF4870 domain-containing protein [Terriglobales bacterium]
MSAAPTNPPCGVMQDECTLGTLAHLLQLVTAWMGPLIIFLVKRDSLFVKFHALQALILQICLMVVWIAGVVVFMITMVANMSHSGGATNSAPPLAVFIVFPLFWIVGMSSWLVVLVLAIVYGIKAGRGEWAGYPVIGGLARNLLKMS